MRPAGVGPSTVGVNSNCPDMPGSLQLLNYIIHCVVIHTLRQIVHYIVGHIKNYRSRPISYENVKLYVIFSILSSC